MKKNYKNICGRQINVQGVPRAPDEVFELDSSIDEIRPLVTNQYIAEVKR